MKHLSTIAAIVLLTSSIHAQWTPRESNTTVLLRDLSFPSEQIGFAVGDSGTIVRTQDAGESWSVVHMDPEIGLFSVHFPTVETGYAVGWSFMYALVLKTVDGGSTWNTCLLDSMQLFTAVHFLNAQTGFVGGSGTILRTDDGGTSWDPVPGITSGFEVSSIHFPSPEVGYFIGGPDLANPIFKTTDGGANVQEITNGYQSIKETTWFVNDSVGYMGGWYGPMLVKTTDGGNSWTDVNTYQDGIWEVHFTDEDNGWYTGWGGGWSYIARTSDGAATWNYVHSDSLHSFEALEMIDGSTGFAAGSHGIILKSTNAGSTGMSEVPHRPALTLYPNPASDRVWISVGDPAAVREITVVNVSGQVVIAVQGPTTGLDVSALPPGSYAVVVHGTRDIRTRSFVITR
jgi:photosystem II stability/assembly factor-like uncharacterized protein